MRPSSPTIPHIRRYAKAQPAPASSLAVRRLDGSDVDLVHRQHRLERALGGGAIGIGDRLRQRDRGDLPGQPLYWIGCLEKSHLSLHQPHALSWPPLPTIAFQ